MKLKVVLSVCSILRPAVIIFQQIGPCCRLKYEANLFAHLTLECTYTDFNIFLECDSLEVLSKVVET